ncbi:hypothetical protein QYE76_023521 [Lolium multiflorum]|uniref:DUF4216 domain-containing protein n=1 Tax=Lolium multiflorum TaxID=4521 RepID=A0AAD8VSV5_LOLMU|nr:hypothetical protein QYE76_023521 [Lolium multiflorum]
MSVGILNSQPEIKKRNDEKLIECKHYDPNIPRKHNPVLRYNAANNEEVPKLSIFVGLGGKSSGSKPYRTDRQERTLIPYVLNTMVEMKPYIETDKEMKSELRKIARGFDHSVEAFNSYDVNGYRFRPINTQQAGPKKTVNSGVVCQGDDGLHYYGRVEDIYELNYGFQKGLNPVVFKCHWFDPRRVRRDPEIGLVEVERNSVYKDVYILATEEPFKPPPPNKDDYRRVDPSAKSVEFYQEEGLPGHFTIGLPGIDDMVVDDEQEDAGMDGDNAEAEAEDVCAPEDLSLLEAFRAGIVTSMQMDHLRVSLMIIGSPSLMTMRRHANPPQYIGNDERCFLAMVMWWTCDQYLKKHEESKKKRAEMRGSGTGVKPNVFVVLKKMKQRHDPETGSRVG